MQANTLCVWTSGSDSEGSEAGETVLGASTTRAEVKERSPTPGADLNPKKVRQKRVTFAVACPKCTMCGTRRCKDFACVERVRLLAQEFKETVNSGPTKDVFEDAMLYCGLENRHLDLHGVHEFEFKPGGEVSTTPSVILESRGGKVLDARKWSGRFWGLWRFYRERALLAVQISGQIPQTIKLDVHAAISWIKAFVTGGDAVCKEGPWATGFVFTGGSTRERVGGELLKELMLQTSNLAIGDVLAEDGAHNSFSLVNDDVSFLVDIGSNCNTVNDVNLLSDVRTVAALVATAHGFKRYGKVGTLAVRVKANGLGVTYYLESVYVDECAPNKVCMEGLRTAGMAPSIGATAGSLTVRAWRGGMRVKHHLWLAEGSALYLKGESAPVGERGVRMDDGAAERRARVSDGEEADIRWGVKTGEFFPWNEPARLESGELWPRWGGHLCRGRRKCNSRNLLTCCGRL